MIPALVLGVVVTGFPLEAAAQKPVTLQEAVEAALSRDLRVNVARADVTAARANALTARAWPNPTFSFTYTGDPPQYHALLELLVENPWLRAARIRAAEAGQEAAQRRFELQRQTIRFEVDSVYAHAAILQELAHLSSQDARDGEELVRITRARRDSGDASTLDLELAIVSQGSVASLAFADSVEWVTSILALQDLMGLTTGRVVISIADSLEALVLQPVPDRPTPLQVAALEADLLAQRAQVSLERTSLFPGPVLSGGLDWHDPTTGSNRKFPVLGLSLPIPLFDRSRGTIAAARAALQKLELQRNLARDETAEAVIAAERARAAAEIRIERSRELKEHARRVVQMTMRGYQEGAFPLTTVLEARRTARDALRQYVQDLGALLSARTAIALAHTIGLLP